MFVRQVGTAALAAVLSCGLALAGERSTSQDAEAALSSCAFRHQQDILAADRRSDQEEILTDKHVCGPVLTGMLDACRGEGLSTDQCFMYVAQNADRALRRLPAEKVGATIGLPRLMPKANDGD